MHLYWKVLQGFPNSVALRFCEGATKEIVKDFQTLPFCSIYGRQSKRLIFCLTRTFCLPASQFKIALYSTFMFLNYAFVNQQRGRTQIFPNSASGQREFLLCFPNSVLSFVHVQPAKREFRRNGSQPCLGSSLPGVHRQGSATSELGFFPHPASVRSVSNKKNL